ncbi:twin transmembrane helix small protein [Aquisalimonas sp. 2447]|uniref:twin transmembrane helix small protein n=1 Tax=Aquisalimonas sp. 2447 TaxID=2740807 RepID=UPI0014326FB3|nr:twin transmembrane helix small protein [Aquisalimonas sp. 2447]QIT56704.1 twin transmembrane helix small protein [Aquisalimonas sp. 2447]
MTLAIKIGVVLAMLAIVFSLFSGAIFLVRDQSSSRRVVRALTWRIGLSVALFAIILVLLTTGVIEPGDPMRP